MEANILLSKIVANPSNTTWSQAYSTINLYVALSVKTVGEGGEADDKAIVTTGKELLERIQREYFSQDQKSLENIKKSIEEATSEFEDKTNISIVLATITGETLYIITVSKAKVILKRGEKIGTVAQGISGEINAFSGNIEANDTIILETEDFAEKLPTSKLSSLLDHLEVTEISENLAPIIHKDSIGTEAAIILQYKKFETEPKITEEEEIEKKEENIPKGKDEQEEETLMGPEPTEGSFFSKLPIPKIGIPKSFGKTKLIIAAIILLAIVLAGSILFEQGNQEKTKREAVLAAILKPADSKFEEANALIALNRGLALDEFTELKDTLTSSQNKLKTGTDERKKLDEFIGKVESKIGELGAGSTLSNQKMIFETAALVTFRGKQLSVSSSDGKISLLDSDGKTTKDIDSKNKNPKSITANDTSIYILGDSGITQNAKSGSTKNAIKDTSEIIAIDTFGSNLYGLTKTGINKYAGDAFSESNYLKSDKLNDAQSFSIDSSIWVVDDGKIREFTKGAEVTFSLSGLTKDLSSNSQIFTDTDYANIYILDPNNSRIISVSKSDGSVKNQYVSKDLKNGTSLAVDEEGKKIYVVISGKLYSFDL